MTLMFQTSATRKVFNIVRLNIPCNKTDKLLFAAATSINIGDGRKISIWHEAWVQGQRPCDFAPNLFMIPKRKNRTLLHWALHNNYWIHDVNLQNRGFTAQHLVEFTRVWREVNHCGLSTKHAGLHSLEANKTWTIHHWVSIRAQFLGAVETSFMTLIWKVWGTQT